MPDKDGSIHHIANQAAPVVNDEQHYENLLEQLIERLPGQKVRDATRWLRRPSARLMRLPAGILLVFGGLLSFLPILGLWMLPLGLALLAEDMPPLRRSRNRLLNWIARRHPQWLAPPSRHGA